MDGLRVLEGEKEDTYASQCNHVLSFYGLGPFIDGDVTFGESGHSEIDLDAGDVIDGLEIAATTRYRGQSEHWAFVLDA